MFLFPGWPRQFCKGMARVCRVRDVRQELCASHVQVEGDRENEGFCM